MLSINTLFMFFIGLCWGSFLHALAVRIVRNIPLSRRRSYCLNCSTLITWYDNIPLLSYFLLRGSCRTCKHKISPLYPLFELLVGLLSATWWTQIGISLWHNHLSLLMAVHIVFLSALIINTATDLHGMILPQFCTVWLIPVGLAAAYFHIIPSSLPASCFGALLGYGLLWGINKLFVATRGRQGMGEGDMELLAMIGAFLGPYGIWITLLVGSWTGLCMGLIFRRLSKQENPTIIPFGPALAAGAVTYLLWSHQIFSFLYGH